MKSIVWVTKAAESKPIDFQTPLRKETKLAENAFQTGFSISSVVGESSFWQLWELPHDQGFDWSHLNGFAMVFFSFAEVKFRS